MIRIFKIHIYESAILNLCIDGNLFRYGCSIACRGPSPRRLVCAEPRQ